MTKITVKKNDKIIANVEIKGHTNYNESGKDIVCASISSIVTTSINALIRLDKKIEVEIKDGYTNISILKSDEQTEILLINMLELLKELEEIYPKNIKYKEV